jgi:hypothetical protein
MGRPKKGVVVPPKPVQAGMTRSEALSVFNFRRQHPLFREGKPCIPWFAPTKDSPDGEKIREIQFADNKAELFEVLAIVADEKYQEFLKPCKKGPPPENSSPK